MFGFDAAVIFGLLGHMGALDAVPFTRCDRCVSPTYCGQQGRCGILDAEEQLHRNEQLRAYWQSVDPNTIDLGPDAVRVVREGACLLPTASYPADLSCALPTAKLPTSLTRDVRRDYDMLRDADSDGGECD